MFLLLSEERFVARVIDSVVHLKASVKVVKVWVRKAKFVKIVVVFLLYVRNVV